MRPAPRRGQSANNSIESKAPLSRGRAAVLGIIKPSSVTRGRRRPRVENHSSRASVTTRLKQPTQKHQTGRPQALLYLVLLRMGFTWPPTLPQTPVRSYRTLSPLPGPEGPPTPKHGTHESALAVYSLLHLPSGHPDRELPGILPCGARTFLPRHKAASDSLFTTNTVTLWS